MRAQSSPFLGRGLFTGERTSVTLAPAASGGIVFQRRDLPGRPEVAASLARVIASPEAIGLPRGFPLRNTTLKSDEDPQCFVMTVEHVLSALWAMSVTDAIVVVDGPEVPILDGSAHDFAAHLLSDGMGAIGHVDAIVIREPVRVEDGRGGVIEAVPTPDPVPTFTYRLDYGPGAPIEPQEFSWSGNEGLYYSQVAGARTFSLRAEAEAMQKAGLFKDFGPEDLLVVGDDGRPIANAFRFHDEPARHKLLDLIGDLALLQRPIDGVVTATRSGHALTHEFSRAVMERWGE